MFCGKTGTDFGWAMLKVAVLLCVGHYQGASELPPSLQSNRKAKPY